MYNSVYVKIISKKKKKKVFEISLKALAKY